MTQETKSLWFVGDSTAAVVAEKVAELLGMDLRTSMSPDATAEEIWTSLSYLPPKAAKAVGAAVFFVNSHDYDSEATTWHIMRTVSPGVPVVALILPESPKVIEGLQHFDMQWVVMTPPVDADQTASTVKEVLGL